MDPMLPSAPIWLNDIHSGLNRTRVHRLLPPKSPDALIASVCQTREEGGHIAVSGCRHAMGGQQFLEGGCVLDLRGLNRLIHLDQQRGLLRVEAGIQWPELIAGYRAMHSIDGPQ